MGSFVAPQSQPPTKRYYAGQRAGCIGTRLDGQGVSIRCNQPIFLRVAPGRIVVVTVITRRGRSREDTTIPASRDGENVHYCKHCQTFSAVAVLPDPNELGSAAG